MCDCTFVPGTGWKGWIELPPQAAVESDGAWVDLSHPLSSAMPRQSFFPVPSFKRFLSIPEFHLNVTRIDMIAHLGTHVDSPRHCFHDGPAFEDVPLERLSGPGLVWRIDVAPDQEIGPEHLQPAAALLQRGDILVLNTGLHHAAGTDRYNDHPALGMAGAQWIIDHGIKLLAVDTPTPDAALMRRQEGFSFPVHRLLLAHGVLIAEHLTNLDSLTGRRVEVLCNALNITGSDGAPARILARPLRDTRQPGSGDIDG